MDGHEESSQEGEDHTVEHVKAKQSLMAHLICSQNKEPDIFTEEGSITHDGCSHGDSPISQLIPGEEISCITQGESKDEKTNSDHPVKLSGRAVGTGVEYPNHMKEDCHHHPMSRPSM
jgi:hypothetical protein